MRRVNPTSDGSTVRQSEWNTYGVFCYSQQVQAGNHMSALTSSPLLEFAEHKNPDVSLIRKLVHPAERLSFEIMH